MKHCIHTLLLLVLLISGCSITYDLKTMPMKIDYKELKHQAFRQDSTDYDYQFSKYSIVKKYADEVNDRTPLQDKSPCIRILLSENGSSRYAAIPNYEIQGTNLIVHVCPYRFDGFNMEEVEPRVIDLLMPLAERLGVKDARITKYEPNPIPIKAMAYLSGSGTLWCFDKNNFMFVDSDDKVTWWGSEKEWNEKPKDDGYLKSSNSPRDVSKAPVPNPPSFFTKEQRERYLKINGNSENPK